MKKISYEIQILVISLSLFSTLNYACFRDATINDVKSVRKEADLRPFEEFFVLKIGSCQATLDIFKKEPSKIEKFIFNFSNKFIEITNFMGFKIAHKEVIEIIETFIAKKVIKKNKKIGTGELEGEKEKWEEIGEEEKEKKEICKKEKECEYLFYGGLDNGQHVALDKSIYKARYLLMQYFFEKSNYWKRNKLYPENFPSINESIVKLKFLSTEPIKITEKASKKYCDTKIIFN